MEEGGTGPGRSLGTFEAAEGAFDDDDLGSVGRRLGRAFKDMELVKVIARCRRRSVGRGLRERATSATVLGGSSGEGIRCLLSGSSARSWTSDGRSLEVFDSEEATVDRQVVRRMLVSYGYALPSVVR